MRNAFYKNWKKIVLVLTSVFWASCDDNSSSAPALYGCPDEYCTPQDTTNVTTNQDFVAESSSSVEQSSSSEMNGGNESSSSIEPNNSSEDEGGNIDQFDSMIAVYGPPCYFNDTCDEETTNKDKE